MVGDKRPKVIDGIVMGGQGRTMCTDPWIEHRPLRRIRIVRFHEVLVVGNVPDDVQHAVVWWAIAAVSGGGGR